MTAAEVLPIPMPTSLERLLSRGKRSASAATEWTPEPARLTLVPADRHNAHDLPTTQAPLIAADLAASFGWEAVTPLLLQLAAHADREQLQVIENLLVQAGPTILPNLLQGLLSEATASVSLCVMVLIRMGDVVLPDLETFFKAHQATHASLQWIVSFLLDELGGGQTVVELTEATPLTSTSAFNASGATRVLSAV
ncbi:MAG: hypothetical protein SFZ03_07475 [Candidatus Melainabacteria bacterium]|nr:hypothetical protein [Candidatus Melainabacteria bacterium]